MHIVLLKDLFAAISFRNFCDLQISKEIMLMVKSMQRQMFSVFEAGKCLEMSTVLIEISSGRWN